MRIDEILYKMNIEIEKEYNLSEPVIEITLTHEAFDKMVIDMAKFNKNESRYSPSWMNDFKIFNVRIKARKRAD